LTPVIRAGFKSLSTPDMMIKNTTLVLALAFAPLAAFAESADLKSAQFEVNALYGRTDSRFDNNKFYGATVAGGCSFGNHLFQLETGALVTENLGGFRQRMIESTYFDGNPGDFFATDERIKSQEFQRIPVWVNYRYGCNLTESGSVRIEFGPTFGLSALTYERTYDSTISNVNVAANLTETETITGTRTDIRERDGDVCLDYGAAVALRLRFTDHWGATLGYRYIRSTEAAFKLQSKETNAITADKVRVADHGTHFASIGVEYRF
jgi:hypothetical protein